MVKHTLFMAAIGSCVAAGLVFGQDTVEKNRSDHVSVTVTGEAKGKPDLMVLELVADATAGNASDALSQCRSKADAASMAIAALSIQNAEVIREMYEFSSPTAASPYGMMQSAPTPAGTRASQVIKVKVRLGGARKTEILAITVSQILDAANKAGVGFNQGPAWRAQVTGQPATSAVTYILEDASALRMKAIDDCLKRATLVKGALAKSGVRTGELVGIGYRQTGAESMANPWMVAASLKGSDSDSAASVSPSEVTVRTTLTLRFRVE